MSSKLREYALEEAVTILRAGAGSVDQDALNWDPELNIGFRPGQFRRAANPQRSACLKLLDLYRHFLDREDATKGISPTAIRNKVKQIRDGYNALAEAFETLSLDEYRAILLASDHVADKFRDKIVPTDYTREFHGRVHTEMSRELRQRAKAFTLLMKPPTKRQSGALWSRSNKGGRGNTFMRPLGIAKSDWLIVHMAWGVFETFQCPTPTTTSGKAFDNFVIAIHQAATGEREKSKSSTIKQYKRMREKFDPISKQLQVAGDRYGWGNFLQFEGALALLRRPAVPMSSSTRSKFEALKTEYLSLRQGLVSGPGTQNGVK